MAKKKKSESRRHTAMIRTSEKAREQAMLAAGMMKKSLADYVTEMILRVAEQDIDREANKLVKRKGGAT